MAWAASKLMHEDSGHPQSRLWKCVGSQRLSGGTMAWLEWGWVLLGMAICSCGGHEGQPGLMGHSGAHPPSPPVSDQLETTLCPAWQRSELGAQENRATPEPSSRVLDEGPNSSLGGPFLHLLSVQALRAAVESMGRPLPAPSSNVPI